MTNVSFRSGPATVSMPVPNWKRLRNMFRRRDRSEYIRVLPKFCGINVLAPDEGEIELYVWVVNFFKRELVPDGFAITYWSYLTMGMPELPWLARGLNAPIPPRSVGSLYSRSQLNSTGIKRLVDRTPREPHYLAGRLGLGLQGELHVEKARTAVSFELEIPRPVIQGYWLAPTAQHP